MNRYYLFLDADNRAIVVEDHPQALDEAPYDRIVHRLADRPVDALSADQLLSRHGGIVISADGQALQVAAAV